MKRVDPERSLRRELARHAIGPEALDAAVREILAAAERLIPDPKTRACVVARPAVADGWLAGARDEVLLQARADVEAGRRRLPLHVDSGDHHRALLLGSGDVRLATEAADRDKVRGVPDGRRRRFRPKETETYIQVLGRPGDPFQLVLPFASAQERAAGGQRIRAWCGARGLRCYAALIRLFSVEARRGLVLRWTLDDQLDAMGASVKQRQDPTFWREVAYVVETLSQLELGIFCARTSKLLSRLPLLLVERRDNATAALPHEWFMGAMKFRLNPAIFDGVRDSETGRLGRQFFPTPAELPHITRSPYAVMLGLLLAIEGRRAWRDHVELAGETLLDYACIPFGTAQRHAARAWRSLEIALEELRRRGQVDRWEWLGPPGLRAKCRIYFARWIVDRTIGGLKAIEEPTGRTIMTGEELRAWREERGLSQAELAEHLRMGVRTIRRAEGRRKLGKRVRAAVEALDRDRSKNSGPWRQTGQKTPRHGAEPVKILPTMAPSDSTTGTVAATSGIGPG